MNVAQLSEIRILIERGYAIYSKDINGIFKDITNKMSQYTTLPYKDCICIHPDDIHIAEAVIDDELLIISTGNITGLTKVGGDDFFLTYQERFYYTIEEPIKKEIILTHQQRLERLEEEVITLKEALNRINNRLGNVI